MSPWTVHTVKGHDQRPVTLSENGVKSPKRSTDFTIYISDDVEARVVWVRDTIGYEIEFDRGSATAIRASGQEFSLLPTEKPSVQKIDGPSMSIARALSVNSIELRDFQSN
jgi:hypothetical protein